MTTAAHPAQPPKLSLASPLTLPLPHQLGPGRWPVQWPPRPACDCDSQPVAETTDADDSDPAADRARWAWLTADKLLSALTGVVVLAVAGFAAVVSYSHIYDLGHAHQEDGTAARIMPLSVDGLIASASLVMLRASMKNKPVPAEARIMLWLGVFATIAANIGFGLPYGWMAAVIAAWPAVAFVGSVEMGVKFIMLAHGRDDDSDSDSGTASPDDNAKPRQARVKRQRRRWRPRLRLVWRRRQRASDNDTESVNANPDDKPDNDSTSDSGNGTAPLTGKALAKAAIAEHPEFDDKQIAAETGLSLRTVQRARGELAKTTSTKRKKAENR